MRKLFLSLCLLGGIMFGASIKSITISGVEIPLIYEKSSIIPTGMIQLIFANSGSAYCEETPGIASLSASILNEGTKELGGVEFARGLEEKAITLYASSSQEFLEFTLSFLKEEEDHSLKFLSMLLNSPNLSANALTKVKDQALASLLAKESDFDYLASSGLAQLLFKNTPLQYPSRGTISSIQGITLEQIRAFLKKSLTLNHLYIVIGGDLDIDATSAKLVQILQKLPIGEVKNFASFKVSSTPQTKTQYKQTEQAYIYFGSPFNLKDYQEEAHKAKVMSFILGASGFGSRMMEEIRVKNGLAYSAYMKVNLSKLVNYASGYLQTKISNQNQSIELVKKVISDFVENGVTQEELDSAKKFLLGSEPLRNETLNQRLNTAFSYYYRGLNPDYSKEELEKINNLTLEDLNAFIKDHKEILDLSFSIITQ
ncbi:insulinase family protein [Helicobacter cholecystus]|uniref:Insulinase family protein n=1 Tax=Helicobacter cholecystus TaxID=45498 RepID=A0A3D8IT67_9HELI|nr:pitrilysin family protein [Helicobacter cholecystus]RDU68223.1 insulinase family protein [Helicobacter cholecystus]VEJ24480.1 processing zinc-metalloprotease [Helicobacter cholecystus]